MYAPVNVERSLAFDRNVAVLLETIGSAAAARRHPSGASHIAVAGVTGTQPHVVKAAAAGDRIVGRTPALMRMLGEVDQVAATDATVLLLGETGTGKELVAKALHAASGRSRRAFVRVNCGSLPNGLIESELFGHERGAFTGATAKREGRFALAHGGTLFLDEIGELPLDLQARLLRVLQEGEFEPLGSSQTRRVDVRVIAATHRDLHEAVRKGDFREDLFYRLHVFPIQLPALRERKDDIPLLIEAFAAAAAQRMQRRFEPVDAESLRRLQAYAWPGNVRELQNMVERAAISSRCTHLKLERFLPQQELPLERSGDSDAACASPRVLTAEELRQLERDNIVRAMHACAWQIAGKQGAAELLGMNPSTLSSRIKALGIGKPH